MTYFRCGMKQSVAPSPVTANYDISISNLPTSRKVVLSDNYYYSLWKKDSGYTNDARDFEFTFKVDIDSTGDHYLFGGSYTASGHPKFQCYIAYSNLEKRFYSNFIGITVGKQFDLPFDPASEYKIKRDVTNGYFIVYKDGSEIDRTTYEYDDQYGSNIYLVLGGNGNYNGNFSSMNYISFKWLS